MEVSFYLRDRGVSFLSFCPSDGKKAPKGPEKKTAIYARICYQGNKVKFYPNISIAPEHWDDAEQRAKKTRKFPEHPEFNTRLDNISVAIKRLAIKYANEHDNMLPDPEILKGLLKETLLGIKKADAVTLTSFFADFIDRSKAGIRTTKKGKPITEGTIKSYSTSYDCLKAYMKHRKSTVDFDDIDMKFYSDFRKYLTLNLKLSTNYIGKHIKVLKTVLNDAVELKVTNNTGYKSSGFSAITEEVSTIYLPEHELAELSALDLSQFPSWDRVRDLFLIGCYTGLRFGDLSRLRPEHITGNMITIIPEKTGNEVVIPVHSFIRTVMMKYGGHFPKALSNQKANDALKDIAAKCPGAEENIGLHKLVSMTRTQGGALETSTLPKHKLVTTHTARRSFATNQYLAKVPTLTIMAITGHKTEKAFMKYIRVTPDEHAKIMQGNWDAREANTTKTISV